MMERGWLSQSYFQFPGLQSECLWWWHVHQCHSHGYCFQSKARRGLTLACRALLSCCSVTKLCPTLCDAMSCRTPCVPILHCLREFAQTHVHWVSDAIQPSHPVLPSSSPALNLSHHHCLFQLVGSFYQVAKVLELQIQHQFFQWKFRTTFL